MNFRRLFNLIFLIALSVQFNITSCSDKGAGSLTAPENEPTNDYEVVVEIISFGGVMGCTAAAIEVLDDPVTDAQITINGVQLTNDTTSSYLSNLYGDTLNELSYLSNTTYNLSVYHSGKEVATGNAPMPSVPEIINLEDYHKHQLNKELVVNWKKVKNATSLQVTLNMSIYDSTTQEYIDKEFDSGLINPSKESIVIPDTLFSVPGEYILGVIAYYGLNAGAKLEEMRDMDGYERGYNIKGAAGIFLTANIYPNTVGLRIIVEQPNTSISNRIAISRKTLKEVFLEKKFKIFKDKITFKAVK